MNRSASLSSSPVLTPGRMFSCTRSSVAARIAPARAILAISSGDFLMIIQSSLAAALETLLHTQRGDGGTDVGVDLVGGAHAVEAAQQPLLVVVGDQRLGLRVVDLEALADHVLAVVV